MAPVLRLIEWLKAPPDEGEPRGSNSPVPPPEPPPEPPPFNAVACRAELFAGHAYLGSRGTTFSPKAVAAREVEREAACDALATDSPRTLDARNDVAGREFGLLRVLGTVGPELFEALPADEIARWEGRDREDQAPRVENFPEELLQRDGEQSGSSWFALAKDADEPSAEPSLAADPQPSGAANTDNRGKRNAP